METGFTVRLMIEIILESRLLSRHVITPTIMPGQQLRNVPEVSAVVPRVKTREKRPALLKDSFCPKDNKDNNYALRITVNAYA